MVMVKGTKTQKLLELCCIVVQILIWLAGPYSHVIIIIIFSMWHPLSNQLLDDELWQHMNLLFQIYISINNFNSTFGLVVQSTIKELWKEGIMVERSSKRALNHNSFMRESSFLFGWIVKSDRHPISENGIKVSDRKKKSQVD